LIRYRDGKFSMLTTQHGLFENLVYNVLEDDFGWFWLNGHRGLQRIPKEQANAVADGMKARVEAVRYGVVDGMLSAEGNGGGIPNSCKTSDGRLWFPTTRGLAVVDPRALKERIVPPLVVIESVVADGEVVFGHGQGEPINRLSRPGSRLRLSPGRARSLLFYYTANSFIVPEKMRFEYMLEGRDRSWHQDDRNLRMAIYTDLKPGNYTFRVRAHNAHGVAAGNIPSFQFSLAPHFHQTWPFYFVCAGLMLALGGTLHLTRMRGLKRIKELENQNALERERSRIARDMHDSLGADLTKIALLTESAGNNGTPQFDRISALANGLVDGIGELVWATHPHCNTLSSLVAYAREYAADLAESAGIDFRSQSGEDLPDVSLSSETRRHLFLAIKEALNNAVKHARPHSISLRFEMRANLIRILIQDDGCGCNLGLASASSTVRGGNGLRNMRERMAAIGGSIEVTSEPDAGTTVILIVCLKPS
jgi:signal transduction histidine kinase